MVSVADVWSLNGRAYNTLPILEYSTDANILDGPGTGRLQSERWPMNRQPQGVIENVEMTVGLTLASDNGDFMHLYETFKSFGKVDFLPVSFVTPAGKITQMMYSPSFTLVMKRIDKNKITYWGSLRVRFIAKEGRP